MEEFQTIEDFLLRPFGNDNPAEKARLEDLYEKMKKKISIEGYTSAEHDYFIHVKIPSDSNPKQSYDVVILFFTDDKSVERGLSLRSYYVKFFSNSPSFIYQFATMYHVNGFLIDALFDKLDMTYADVAPKNPKKIFYDKSIYSACRYLVDDKFKALNKIGIIARKKKSLQSFFKDIRGFEDIKMAQELSKLDKDIKKELDQNKKRKETSKRRKNNSYNGNKKIRPKNDTLVRDSKKAITIAKQVKKAKRISATKRTSGVKK